MAPTTVLICDDSRTYATALRMLLEQDHSVEVVGIAPSGEHAVEAVKRLRPALVTMDLELPGMSGIQAIQEIMRTTPVPVVVLSAHAQNGSRDAAAALAAGAVDAMAKTQVRIGDATGPAAAALRSRLKLLAQARVTPTASLPTTPPAAPRWESRRQVGAIGIGASTGGPRALQTVLRGLPADFPLPILVVQHIGSEFLDSLARWLNQEVALPVGVARDRMCLAPGVWFGPGGAHLTLDCTHRVSLDRRAPSGPHQPSVDVLLESMAASLGRDAVGVVLTGMGTDGACGVGAVTAAGGLVLAQDEASSVVFGMPRAAAENGAQVLGLADIPAALCRLRARRSTA